VLTFYQFNLYIPPAEPESSAPLAGLTPPPISIHTCTMSANVTIDGWVQNALKEDCQLDDGKITDFDRWISSQMLLTGYNGI